MSALSIYRRKFGSRRSLAVAVGMGAFLGVGSAQQPAQAAAPHYSDILPLSKIKAGMTGYGLTTFKGTTISRFEVTVVGIMRKANNGHDLILVRMKGGPITERGANLIHGMSGSPIYINDKCIGAFSQGEQWPKEPIGMVTPIEDMLEAWDPDIPQQPPYFQPAEKQPSPVNNNPSPTDKDKPEASKGKKEKGKTASSFLNPEHTVTLPSPITVGGRRIKTIVLNASPNSKLASRNDCAVMHRATTFAVVSGVTDKEVALFQKELDKRGYAMTLQQAPVMGAGKANIPASSLKPGSVFGTFLSSGDVEFGAFGTVTYRKGNRILGFGHPFFGLGALNAAATTASVVDVFSGLQSSHIIAEAGPVVGTFTQDRNFSVGAELGRKPTQIPFTITVNDESTHRSQTFRTQMFQHPDLTASLMSMIGQAAVSRIHNMPGDMMARVTTTVDAGEVGRTTRTNLLFDADDISQAVTKDLTDITGIISGNPFYPLPIKGATMNVHLYSGHNTATIERIFLKQGRYEPGDTLDVGVVLKPYRRDPIFKNLTLKIPADTPTGRYALAVRGGSATVTRIGPFILSSGGAQDTQAPPVNVRQMLARLGAKETNTDMVARLVLNTAAPAIEGEKLSQLPPNLAVLMRSDRNSGVRIERDEVRNTAPTDYVVSGTQQLVVTIVRKNTQETPGLVPFTGTSGASTSTSSGTSSSLPSGSNGASVQDDDAQVIPDGVNMGLQYGNETQRWLNELLGVSETREKEAAQDPTPNPIKPPTTEEKTKNAKTKNSKQTPVVTPPVVVTPTPPATTGDTKPATTPSDTESVKIVARQLQVWRQSGANGFASGKFTGTSVTATGELRLAPRLRRLATTNETYIWSVVSDNQGNVYAGTGTTGKILKVDTSGNVKTFAQLPIVSVQSLLMAKDGTMWAGSSVKGQLFHVKPDGTYTLVASLPEKYILALAEDGAGNIYVGPGGGGNIYKIAPGYSAPDPNRIDALKPYVKTPADYITSMTLDSKDNLYVGTGNEGIVYRITPDGKSSVLYDAKENSITALAMMPDGSLYAGTGPKGLLYRITPDGLATVVYDRATSFYTGLRAAKDGTLYATTVNAAYHINPVSSDPARPVVQPLDNPRDVDFLTLGLLPDNTPIIGTGNIGELYTAAGDSSGSGEGRSPGSGTFESVIHDAKLVSQWGALRVNAMLNGGAQLAVVTRTGNVAEPDSTWSDWQNAAPISSNEHRIASPPARFIQYRLTLTPVSGSAGSASGMGTEAPSVREVSLSYMPRNQAPRVAFSAPLGGERWAKSQTIRWSGLDPDSDTLSYELFYSTDGVNWKPMPAGTSTTVASPSTVTPSATTGNTTAAVTPAISLEDIQKRLEAQNAPESVRRMVLESAQRRLAAGGAGSGGSAGSRDTSKTWDTKTLPDGSYWLKVVASDYPSNPSDPLTAQAISDPFVICNSLPQLMLNGATIGTDRRVVISGTAAQSLITITAVQYRVDAGDWLAAVPGDGLFDSTREGFGLTTLPLTPGKHTIEVAAFNAASSKATQRVDVTVP